MNLTAPYKGLSFISSFIAFIAIIAILYPFRGPVLGQMTSWNLLTRPEPFTELYLNNSLELPRTPIKKRSSVTFSFSVHNVEGQNMSYPYVAYLVSSQGTTTIERGTVDLQNGGSVVVPVSYTFGKAYPSVLFVVELTQLDQEIHFLLPSRE